MSHPQAETFEDLSQLCQQGRLADAERVARTILDAHPNNFHAAHVLGFLLLNTKRTNEAVEIYATLTHRVPDEALYWGNFGTALRASGRFDEAEQAYVRALQLQPGNPDFLASMGFLDLERGRILKARERLLASLKINPNDIEVRIHAARACLNCGEWEQADALLKDWQMWLGNTPVPLRIELARLLIASGKGEQMEPILRADSADPEYGSSALACLVLLLERVNRIEEASALLERLPAPQDMIDADSRHDVIEACALMAMRKGDHGSARSLYEKLLEQSKGDHGQATTLFQLAKLCDKMGDQVACMNYLSRAHADQISLASELVLDLLDPATNPFNITTHYLTAGQIQNWKAVVSPPAETSPIFILGFPRSGTTMLEQMLDAHPNLVSMDEQPFVQHVIERMQSIGLQYPEQLGELDSAQCETLRNVYWSAVSNVVRIRPEQRLVDKNPLTTLRLPLLVRLFPNAKIIFAVRHPCDVVLSNYMQQFNAPAYIAMCANLARLATGYAIAMKFWNAHVELLQPRVFEWQYERVIENFDDNVEQLGTFLDLDDTSALRNFSEHARIKGYIGTPSYAQVTQPLYASSIGRWKRYRNYFEPILPILEPAMRHWGYKS